VSVKEMTVCDFQSRCMVYGWVEVCFMILQAVSFKYPMILVPRACT
jgi:hypothetical protein